MDGAYLVHAPVKQAKPPVRQSVLDGPYAHPSREQLSACDHAVLLRRDHVDERIAPRAGRIA
jgi:hypothetical protein